MTGLVRLDGPETAALSDQLVAVYRAAMSAAPFHETEVETGWFAEELAGEVGEAGFRCWVARDGDRVAGFAYGLPTPEVPAEGWYGLLRDAVGEGAGEWLEGQFAVVWIAVALRWRGRAWAGSCRSGCSPGPAPSGPGWSPTTGHPGPRPLPLPRVPGARSRPPRLARRREGRPRRRPPADQPVARPAGGPQPAPPISLQPDPPASGPPVGEATSPAE